MERRRKFTREFKLEAVRLIKERGVSYAQASQDLGVHVSQLRNWVKALADDPQHAFPGHGQMKPEQEEIAQLKRGAVLVALLSPHSEQAAIQALADAGVTAFAMELLPRISRAQAMDVLSSQANLAGYKAVIDAAAEFGRAMPMMMTAAGTIAPARVVVMGVGVAGLQAIATAKRLGAIVSATDVRPATKEQVESLGGTFVAVMDEEFKNAQTAGGYAKEMSKEYQAKQAALTAERSEERRVGKECRSRWSPYH